MITEKQREANRRYRLSHVEVIKERKKLYRIKNLEKIKEQERERWTKYKDKYSALSKIWRAKNIEKITQRRLQMRIDALNNYSDGAEPHCMCCGEKEINFLCIDHINGGGVKHRKQIKGGNIYLWLKKNNYPSGFRTLCHNCNSARGFYGECPHDKSK